ncbi:twitching motility protein PilT [Bryobacterales bacterium F-183]|nr:twitching motility protein PilT [Bryobacterales bacterium F-183]
MAWMQDEPSADRVQGLFDAAQSGTVPPPLLRSINAGEVYYMLARKRSIALAEAFWDVLPSLPLKVVEVTLEDVRLAARIKSRNRLSYADSFGVVLAQRHNAVIWTGDPEFLTLGGQIRLEWLGAPR